MELTWLGHSAFALKVASGQVALLDPYLAGNPHPIERCDAILLSHGHSDHLGSTLTLAKRFAPAVVAIHELAVWLEGQGIATAAGMNKGGTLDLGYLRATMTHAFHSSSTDGNIYLGEAAGYVIEADGKRLYFAGDTCVFGDMRLIAEIHGPIDIALLPIGDRYTMGPKEASYACRLLRPKLVVPMHWGTFPMLTGTPAALETLITDLPGTRVAKLTPGGMLTV